MFTYLAALLATYGASPAAYSGSLRMSARVKREIATCKRCKEAHSREMIYVKRNPDDRDPIRIALDGRRAEFLAPWVCGCGRENFYQAIRGKLNPKIKCNARCVHSKGYQCECSCGGKNHGSGH